jgi:molybdate transport system regulatory protein
MFLHVAKDQPSPAMARHWRGRLAISSEHGEFLSEPRIGLLEAIDTHGSLSGAARSVPMSYKAAWDTVNRMQYLAREPLVMRMIGGSKGGSTTLTEYGRRIVALYRLAEHDCQTAISELLLHMAAHEQDNGRTGQRKERTEIQEERK